MTANGDGSRIAQATGRVAVQVGCTVDDALEILQIHAKETAQTVEQVADAVLAGTLRFDDDE